MSTGRLSVALQRDGSFKCYPCLFRSDVIVIVLFYCIIYFCLDWMLPAGNGWFFLGEVFNIWRFNKKQETATSSGYILDCSVIHSRSPLLSVPASYGGLRTQTSMPRPPAVFVGVFDK